VIRHLRLAAVVACACGSPRDTDRGDRPDPVRARFGGAGAGGAEELDAIADSLLQEPSIDITKMAVQVRVPDPDLDPDRRQQLADLRAKAVVDYLATRHVDRSRLVPEGLAGPPNVPAGQVTFLVLERAPD
jgi:hypothetical protein